MLVDMCRYSPPSFKRRKGKLLLLLIYSMQLVFCRLFGTSLKGSLLIAEYFSVYMIWGYDTLDDDLTTLHMQGRVDSQ